MGSIISRQVAEELGKSSWIRRMFEEGARLKAQHGEGHVFDFSLGNPILEPPAAVHQALLQILANPPAGLHRYPPNAGLPQTRQAVAEWLERQSGIPHRMEHVIITCGAAGGLNILLKALLNPGDEVLAFTPFFPEYTTYAANHGGVLRTVPCDAQFQPDLQALEAALGPRVRALLINSPNNPSGAVYSSARMAELAQLLQRAEARYGRPLFLISDEPYRKLVFDSVQPPWLNQLHPHTAIVCSHSKDLGLAGERLGWVALHPQAAQAGELSAALAWANRVLGFVNAPTLLQRVLPQLLDAAVDVDYYRRMRDLATAALQGAGYSLVPPQGAFFVFPQSPIPDDVAFARLAQAKRVLVAPGSGFGAPGHFRLSLAVQEETIRRAAPLFAQLATDAAA